MKKGFLFTGLLIALILLGGYVLLAKDAKENIDSTLIRLGLRSAQPIEQPAQPQQAILIKSTPAEKKAPAVKEAPAEKEVPDAKKARKVEEEPVKIPEPVIDWPSTSAMGSAYVAKPAVKKVDKKAPQTEMEALPKTMSKKDRIELIGQRIDELKMQGLEYTDLLNELNNLHGGATKPARRHLDATGDDCTDPIVITLPADLPFTDAAQTNCGRLDDYENTCLGYYDSGEDIIYQLTVTATCTVEIGLDPGTTTYTGICIDDECPPADPCMAFSTRGYSGGAHGLDCMILDPGTYYIMIDTWSAPDCIPSFDLTINTCTYVDPCTPDVSVTLPAALPYSDLGQTNCGLEDDFNATCLGSYDNGEDILYEVTVTAQCTVEINLDPGPTTYSGILIDDVCPPGASCMAFSTVSGAAPHGLDCMVLAPGTYYIMVDTYPLPDCIPAFDLTITTCVYTDPCTPDVSVSIPAALPYIDIGQTNCGLGDDFNSTCLGSYDSGEDILYEFTVTEDTCINVELDPNTTTGTGILLDDECPPDASTCIATSTNYSASPHGFSGISLTAGTYYIIVDSYNYYSTCIPDFDLTITGCIPCPYPNLDIEPNGDCTTAQGVLCGDTLCGEIEIVGDNDWYELVIPDTAVACTIDVFADDTPGMWPYGTGLDPEVWLYASDCVTQLGNDDDGGIGTDSRIVIECLDPGTYYVRVQHYSDSNTGPYVLAITCGACPDICVIECPCAGTRGCFFEGEPDCYDGYVDTYNGGCNSTPYVFQSIACDDTVCGSSGTYVTNATNMRDTDWYEITLTDPWTRLYWCAVAEFDYLLYIYQAGTSPDSCDDKVSLDYENGNDCDTVCVNATVPAGTYWLYISPQDYTGVLCGDTSEYVAWLTCEVVPPCPYPDRDVEPNDDCTTAQPASCGDTLCGEIDVVGDHDWYELVITDSAVTCTIDVFADDTPYMWPFGFGLDPTVYLYESDCVTQIALGGDNYGPPGPYQYDSRIVVWCLDPGTYYIMVKEWLDSEIGPYVLAVTCSQCICTIDYSIQVDCGGYSFGAPSLEGAGNDCPNTAGEDHVYEIEILEDALYNFSLCGTAADSAFDSELYLQSSCCRGTELAYDDDGCDAPVTSMSKIRCVSLSQGETVYLCVEEAYSSTVGHGYQIDIDCCPPCPYPSLDVEPNDTCTTAQAVACWDTLCGTIDVAGDHDWYELVITDSAQMCTIDVFADDTPTMWPYGLGLNPEVYLYADDCVSMMASNDNNSGPPGPSSYDSRIEICLDPGTYYIMVQEAYDTGTGPYVLAVSCGACPPCPVDYSIQVDCQGYTFNAPSLQGAGDDCANGTGEDHMYEIEILENGEYTFSLCGTNPDSTFDSKLYLQTQCCRGIELGYDDDGCPTPVSALSEILCVDLLMGQIVYLDVEEFSSYTTGHEYQLDISCCIPCSLWVNCCSTEETEPNDVCPTEVDPHTIACFDTICGKVCPDTEHDVYPIVVPAMTIMTLLVSDGELCDHYPTAYVANNLLDDTCGTLGTGNTSGWILTNPTATPWNLYIDIYQTTFGHATYKIATECCDIVDYCENPIVIPPGLNYTHWENTCCATDTVPCVFADSCGDETCYDSGKDVIYEFTPTVVRSWSFIASGDGDNQIMVTTVCGDTSTCVGSADNTYTGDAEVITLVDLPINTYYISTSLYSTGCGACSLQVISPEPVTNLTAWRVGDDVVLRWGSTGAPQYSVYSDTLADGTFTTFEATVLAPSTSWTDVGIVTPGMRKYYKVYSSTP